MVFASVATASLLQGLLLSLRADPPSRDWPHRYCLQDASQRKRTSFPTGDVPAID